MLGLAVATAATPRALAPHPLELSDGSSSHAVVLIHYHKTGYEVSKQLCELLSIHDAVTDALGNS